MHVNDLLKVAVEAGASDLHLKVGSYPMMRLRGTLTPAAEDKKLDHEDVVAMQIRTIDELGLPQVLKQIAEEERGLVLVTGTTGSGKSTTLAAMIDHINTTRSAHIMTIEDPIEYLHRDYQSIVNQREVSVDTTSFAKAL